VITATHDLGLVEDIADECFVLQRGKIAAAGNPDELLRNQVLLEQTNLIHSHRHRHGGRSIHTHAHTHPHRHE